MLRECFGVDARDACKAMITSSGALLLTTLMLMVGALFRLLRADAGTGWRTAPYR